MHWMQDGGGGYACSDCGAPSPTGLGECSGCALVKATKAMAETAERARQESKDRASYSAPSTQIDFGYYVPPKPLTEEELTEQRANYLEARAYWRSSGQIAIFIGIAMAIGGSFTHPFLAVMIYIMALFVLACGLINLFRT